MKSLSHFIFSLLLIVPQYVCSQYITQHSELNPFYSPTGRPRMVAEWEPALGTLITWPLSLPHKLIIELAKDNKLFVLVNDRKAQQEAIGWFSKWNITPDRVRFITAPQGIDASWTRDWGPHAVFTPDGSMKLADGKYLYATPGSGLRCDDTLTHLYFDEQNNIILTKTDDQIPEYISSALNLEMIKLPFAFTGGNVISDGQRTGFSTCALTNENRFTGVSDEKFFNDLHQLLGIENHHIISNFETEGIQHIDCYMKLLDEERIFVMRLPEDHPAYEQYEGIITHELSYLKNAYGRPYQILRLDTDRFRNDEVAAYSNSLILNKVIYVPLYGIPQDSIALRQWRDAMPGYTVKGFTFFIKDEPALSEQAIGHYKICGWNGGDALHCRTRAIWDPQMIYISVDRLPALVAPGKEYPIRVIIKDYSGKGLVPESLKLNWRLKGETKWKDVFLKTTQIPDQYIAAIPGGYSNLIEYFIEAESLSGKKETMPRTAPAGTYSFDIQKVRD